MYLPAVKMLLQLTEFHQGFSFHLPRKTPWSPCSRLPGRWGSISPPWSLSTPRAALAPNPSAPSSRRHSEVTSPALPGGARLLPAVPGRGWDRTGGTVRHCRGRRFLPSPGRAGPVPPGWAGQGRPGTHLAPWGTGPGWSRLPGAGRGPRPARARSPRRGLRCQQTRRHFLRPRRKRHRALPRKHRPGRNARSAGTRRRRGRSVTSRGRDATRRRQ